MNNFVITCCSTADLPREYLIERNIPYVCFHYFIDGVEYVDDLGVSISSKDFFKKIRDGAMPSTSQVNVNEFTDFFESFLKDGKDIIHVALSSGISGTANSANIAKAELQDKYPDRKITVVDSLGASSGFGLLVDALADMRDDNKSYDEIVAFAEGNKLNVHHWFFTSDLSHLRRGGRVSSASAIAGTILGICPLMNVSFDGKLIPREKIKGKKRVIKASYDKMREFAEGELDYNKKCFISHADCYEDAKALADLIETNFKGLNGKVMINNIGTVIGSHTGPGTVALFFFGQQRID